MLHAIRLRVNELKQRGARPELFSVSQVEIVRGTDHGICRRLIIVNLTCEYVRSAAIVAR